MGTVASMTGSLNEFLSLNGQDCTHREVITMQIAWATVVSGSVENCLGHWNLGLSYEAIQRHATLSLIITSSLLLFLSA